MFYSNYDIQHNTRPINIVTIKRHTIIHYLGHNRAVTIVCASQKDDRNSNGAAMNPQFELFDIDNPCVGICQSNKKGYCFGCLRSRPERQLWLSMSTEERREVLRLIAGRKQRIEQMRQRRGEQLGFDFEEVVEVGELF